MGKQLLLSGSEKGLHQYWQTLLCRWVAVKHCFIPSPSANIHLNLGEEL